MLPLEWAGERFSLLPDKAVHWPRRHAVILADPHFGKAGHFRQAGIPVPAGATRSNLERIDALIEATAATHLIILGDLFHARGGVTESMIGALRAWRRRRSRLRITVVAGNHDRHAGPPPEDLEMETVDEQFVDGDLVLRHHPIEQPGRFVLAGHIHPAVRLTPARKAAGRSMRVSCFHLSGRVAVLPAFGAFTGMHVIRPRAGDRVFAVGPGQVVEVSPSPGPGRSPSPVEPAANA